MLTAEPAYGQYTLSSVALQATRNSERVKVAESDLLKAKAALSGARDVYIPSVSVASGLGASSGITLSVPTAFTASAQSLIFNDSQRNYIRATRFGVEAAEQCRHVVDCDPDPYTWLTLTIDAEQDGACSSTDACGSRSFLPLDPKSHSIGVEPSDLRYVQTERDERMERAVKSAHHQKIRSHFNRVVERME